MSKNYLIKKMFIYLLASVLIAINTITFAANVPSLTITVPFSPIPIKSDDLIKLGYELEISPFEESGLILTKAEVLNADTKEVLLQLENNLLAQFYHPIAKSLLMAKQYKSDALILKQPRISFWVSVKPGKVPSKIIHRLTFNNSNSSSRPIIIFGGETKLRSDFKPMIFAPPLRGAGWFTEDIMFSPEANTPLAHHFLLQLSSNNITHVPFRYAVDFVLFNSSHKEFKNSGKQNRDWYGYGKEVYAVTNGTIVRVENRFHENPVVGVMDLDPTGNYVIIDHGDGQYVGYAHLMFGSIKVKSGQKVEVGDVIGRVGNNGGSFIPHLHLQAMDRPSMVNSEGLPFLMNSFDVTGICPAKGFKYNVEKFWFFLKVFFGIDQDYSIGLYGTCVDYLQPKHNQNAPLGNHEIVMF